jgi:cysteinyl-tRNA synthetase
LKALGATLGLLQTDPATFLQGAAGGELDVQALVDERAQAKRDRNYARSDEIRRQLEAAGVVLEDKPGGKTEWRRK